MNSDRCDICNVLPREGDEKLWQLLEIFRGSSAVPEEIWLCSWECWIAYGRRRVKGKS